MNRMRQLPHPKLKAITLARVLAALSDPVRLSIVSALADGAECGWGEFDVGVGASTLSHHIKVLREAGVVNHRKDGTHCFVALRPDLEVVFPGLLKTILTCAARERHVP
jgi:DNA-binding transcriptional ArsR family regulator